MRIVRNLNSATGYITPNDMVAGRPTRSATGSWRRRRSDGGFVANKPLDVRMAVALLLRIWSVQSPHRRARRLNFRFGDHTGTLVNATPLVVDLVV